jgi:beta-glucanase (GH16 family)
VLGGAAAATAVANASGVYTFTGLSHGDYTVTPQRAGYTFTPAGQNVTVVNANVSGVNFTAEPPTFAVSGTIVPLAGGVGATLALNGRVAKTTVADESGAFVFTGVPNGTYQITVSNTGYAFTPSAQLVTVADADATGITFSAEPASDPMPVGPAGPWTVTFRDEFDGSLLDRTKWATAYGNGMRTNNDELEWYVDDDATHVVSDGTLKLTAFAQSSEPGFPYTSGMISSHDGFNQMYGYFEARVKLPSGRGLWPAFWTLPLPANWPPEIDIMENLGHDCTTAYVSNHWSAAWPSGVGEPRGGNTTIPYVGTNFCSGFHTFGVEWTSTYLDFYIDGVRRARITDHVPQANAVFSGMYLLANLAVGGSWPGAPNSQTVFPAVYEIDYIRAWRR